MQVIHKLAVRLIAAGLLFGMALSAARAADAVCEPAKLAAKYPGLNGKTVKI